MDASGKGVSDSIPSLILFINPSGGSSMYSLKSIYKALNTSPTILKGMVTLF